MIKFRYKRKEPTNIVGSKSDHNTSNLNKSAISTKTAENGSCTANKDANNKGTKENCKPAILQQQHQQQQQLQQLQVNNNNNKSNTNNVTLLAATTTQPTAAKTAATTTTATLKTSIPTQLITSAPINIVSSTAQHLQHPQHCQMVLTAGTGGTLPRSTPKKLMDPREGHKSATLTRQSNTLQNNRKMLTSMAKVASTAELAVMGYTNKPNHNNNNGSNTMTTSIASGIILSPEAIQDRDRCINAVIVSRFFSLIFCL